MNPNWTAFRLGLLQNAAWLRIAAVAAIGRIVLLSNALHAGVETEEKFAELRQCWEAVIENTGLASWEKDSLNDLLAEHAIPIRINATLELLI